MTSYDNKEKIKTMSEQELAQWWQDHQDDGTDKFNVLDSFTHGYFEVMFWTECNEDSEEDLRDKGLYDLSGEAYANAVKECQAFQEKHKALLEAAYEEGSYDETRAGHDFWLTRCGHGTGFWDREIPGAKELGDTCGYGTEFGNVSLYCGDDNLIYFGG